MQKLTGDVPLVEKSVVCFSPHRRTVSLIGVFLIAYGLSAIVLIALNMTSPRYLWGGLLVIFLATEIYGSALVISPRYLERQ